MSTGSRWDDRSLSNNEYIRFDRFFGAGEAAGRSGREPMDRNASAGLHDRPEMNRDGAVRRSPDAGEAEDGAQQAADGIDDD